MSRIDLFVDTHVQYAFLKSGIKVLADERDKKKFLDFVLRLQQERELRIYAFCILDNEAHFLMGVPEKDETAEPVLRDIKNWYAGYAAAQEHLQGRKFRVRSHAVQVKSMEEMLTLCMQIHALPVVQKYVEKPKDYWWSSYQSYRGVYEWQGVAYQPLLLYLDSNIQKARKKFLRLQRKSAIPKLF